jgi:hypothetical protein
MLVILLRLAVINCAYREDQGLFPGGDLPCYERELKCGTPDNPIRCG